MAEDGLQRLVIHAIPAAVPLELHIQQQFLVHTAHIPGHGHKRLVFFQGALHADSFIIRPARGIFQSFFPNSGFSESCTNLRRKFSLPGKCPGSPIAERTDPSEEILYLHHFGTALRGGKGSCRADFSTGRLRHSRHSALPSRTWWNVFLIGNAKFPDILRFPAHTYFPFSCKYCYREENASFGAEKGEMIYESYRYRSPGR